MQALGIPQRLTYLTVTVAVTVTTTLVSGQETSVSQPVAEILSRYCFDCHSADVQEANIQLDTLDLKDRSFQLGETLDKVLRAVGNGKMPPEEAESLPSAERTQLVSLIEGRLDELSKQLKPSLRRSRNRRLTVEEYNFTMQPLFGVDAVFADMLPPDAVSTSGYKNDNERLGLSFLQIEAYLDGARRAITRYVQSAAVDDSSLMYHIEFEDLFYATGNRYGTRKRAPQSIDAATFAERQKTNVQSQPKYVAPLGPKLPGAFSDEESMRAAIPKLNQQYVAYPQRLPIGEMVVRVRAAGTPDRKGRPPRMRVEAGITLGDGCSIDKRILGEVDVTASLATPETFEFRMRLEDIPTKGSLSEEATFDRLSVFDMDQIFISNVSSDRHAVFALGRGGYSDLEEGTRRTAKHLRQMASKNVCFLHLDCIQIEMSPGLADGEPYRWQIPVVDKREEELPTAKTLIKRFMQAAYRRPVEANEVETKLELFRKLREREYSFDQSVRETMVSVLVSPSFLFLESHPTAKARSQPGALTPHQLASRLAYLLWMSPPDSQLMQLADDGSLDEPQILRRAAARMMADPKSRRFTENFCQQWLCLDRHANVAIHREHYPTYDEDLAADTLRETLAYFHKVLVSDASALDLIDSDYAMLNDRLAEHYELNAVVTGQLKKVRLPQGSVRGGLLTQASLLTMNSDGVDSHPIKRGVWLLDRLMHDPPPPPPPNVPPLEDDDPATRDLSLKQQIALHRQPNACQACHDKIDPWGIPFENFDATGRWRDASTHHVDGKPESRTVDSKTVLPNGDTIKGIAEFKRYLRNQRRDQFATAVVHNMLTYALGRPPDFMDRPHVVSLEEQFHASDYRLKELVFAIIESPLFREP